MPDPGASARSENVRTPRHRIEIKGLAEPVQNEFARRLAPRRPRFDQITEPVKTVPSRIRLLGIGRGEGWREGFLHQFARPLQIAGGDRRAAVKIGWPCPPDL